MSEEKYLAEIDKACDQIAIKELCAENKKLRAALKPFAAEASMWADAVPDSYRPGLTERGQKVATGKARFTMGNLRRAAKLLAEKS